MNRKRRVYVSMLAMGLISLTVDKLFLGGGGPSAASAAGIIGASETGAPVASNTANELRSLAASLDNSYARQLADLLESHSGGGNAFKPGAAWNVPQILEPAPTGKTREESPIRVSSVVLGRVPMALINGRTVQQGDEIAPGVVIEAIDAASVLIRKGDEVFRIAVGD